LLWIGRLQVKPQLPQFKRLITGGQSGPLGLQGLGIVFYGAQGAGHRLEGADPENNQKALFIALLRLLVRGWPGPEDLETGPGQKDRQASHRGTIILFNIFR
jgi:hypothetical protein